MIIACLGWGSLIWRPGNLQIQREWFNDGPFLPIEFVRTSNDGRLTLVISETAMQVRSLWALMATDSLDLARDSLRIREGILKENLSSKIGYLKVEEETTDRIKSVIKDWAITKRLDAVIWTSLPARYNNLDGKEPTKEEALKYLRSLDINRWENAQEYIRKAPKQIDTEFRRSFEKEFGWTYIE